MRNRIPCADLPICNAARSIENPPRDKYDIFVPALTGYLPFTDIRRGLYLEGAAAGFGEAFGNRQSQAGAAIRTALVRPDEPDGEVHALRQFLREVFRRESVAIFLVGHRDFSQHGLHVL